MTVEQQAAALEARVDEILQRLVALERRLDHQSSNEALRHDNMRAMKQGVEALEKQTPVNSAAREVMWRRIEALEGTPGEAELPPVMANMLRRLVALEERMR